jgi:methionyl-tRNA synthetase
MPDQTGTFAITTPLYYVNSYFHLGHTYTTFVCDTITRFHKMLGDETFFITGSDEHGVKIKEAAESHGMTPIQWADRIVEDGKALWKRIGVDYDYFVRTTQREPEDHYRDVQRFFRRIYDRGDIYLGEYEGLYCVGCEKYLTEKDLVDGKCPEHDSEPVPMKEQSLFFKLSKWAPVILEMLESEPDRIRPESRRNEIISKLKGGVDDLAVSRTKMKWGIPLDEIAPGHVCYVWFDALLGYATAAGLGEYLDELEKKEKDPSCEMKPTRFAKFWPNCLHIIAKDILWFHTVIWPAMQLAAELDPVDRKRIISRGSYAHGYLLERGRKMSKTLGNILDPYPYLDLLGSDALRFFLLREVTFGEDGSINHEAIAEKMNSDLANDLGNLLNRTLVMIEKDSDGKIPAEGAHNTELMEVSKEAHDNAVEDMKNLAFSRAIESIWELVRLANRNIEETEPWRLRREGKLDELHAFLYDQAQALHNLAILLHPFLPELTRKIWEQLGLPGRVEDHRYRDGSTWGTIDPGTCIHRGDPIAPRIDIQAFLQQVEILSAKRAEEKDKASTAPVKEKDKAATAPVGEKPLIKENPMIEDKPVVEQKPSIEETPTVPEIKPEITFDEFLKVDLRIATILECERVPGADKLLKMQIDLGREKRQIIAGIAKVYPPEQLVGRQIIVVANLLPRKVRGEMSNGMLLATGEEMTVTLLQPDKLSKPGDTVH